MHENSAISDAPSKRQGFTRASGASSAAEPLRALLATEIVDAAENYAVTL